MIPFGKYGGYIVLGAAALVLYRAFVSKTA